MSDQTPVPALSTPPRVVDKAAELLKGLTESRGEVYGHPYDDFDTVGALAGTLDISAGGERCIGQYDGARMHHAMYMVCVKLARLKTSPYHVDSWADIAGYAKTALMCLDKMGKLD